MDPERLFTCSPTTLLIAGPVDELPDDVRTALSTWCETHRIDLASVSVDHLIERDPAEASLTWRTDGARGVQRRTIYSPEPRGTWPAPFPDAVRTWPDRTPPTPPTPPTPRRHDRRPSVA
ncbi:hypothetical protein [Nocardioides sp.]|uniref:hypothetical protein n=1 Tax=Nocardioides sp. TaxID=35761 RepID=UPI00271FDC72|nr:hypothetical protein [Nocardioides sp.]MDO9455154.1 hypothetical protein [Nocardioides sp.]